MKLFSLFGATHSTMFHSILEKPLRKVPIEHFHLISQITTFCEKNVTAPSYCVANCESDHYFVRVISQLANNWNIGLTLAFRFDIAKSKDKENDLQISQNIRTPCPSATKSASVKRQCSREMDKV